MHQEFALNNMIAKYNLINRKLQDKINALIDDIVITEGDYVQYGVRPTTKYGGPNLIVHRKRQLLLV